LDSYLIGGIIVTLLISHAVCYIIGRRHMKASLITKGVLNVREVENEMSEGLDKIRADRELPESADDVDSMFNQGDSSKDGSTGKTRSSRIGHNGDPSDKSPTFI